MHGIDKTNIAVPTQAKHIGHFFPNKIINDHLTTIEQIAVIHAVCSFFMIMMAVVPSHIAVNLQKFNIQKSRHVTKAMAGLCLDLSERG